MDELTKEWLDDAEYDIGSAKAMLKAGRYFYMDDKNVITRYPDGRKQIASALTKEYSKALLEKTEGMFSWLKKRII